MHVGLRSASFCKHCSTKSLNEADQASGRSCKNQPRQTRMFSLSVGAFQVGIINIARIGFMFECGGSPSAISERMNQLCHNFIPLPIVEIPRLHMSHWIVAVSVRNRYQPYLVVVWLFQDDFGRHPQRRAHRLFELCHRVELLRHPEIRCEILACITQ